MSEHKGLPPVAPRNLRAYAEWFEQGKLTVGAELCFHPNVFSTTLRDYADGIEAEKAIRDDLLDTLRTIANFAVGHGDVCEIITKRARAAIQRAENRATIQSAGGGKMSEWFASQYLDDSRWGILDSNNHIIIGVSKGLTQEQVDAVVFAHNQDISAGGK